MILQEYCHPLSLIMRKQNLDHYFIDACAGSGKVQAYSTDDYLDGSPLIMAKTREWVENTIKDKSKSKHVKCIFIEINPETYELLKKETQDYPNCEVFLGDCNQLLPNILDKLNSGQWKPFAFIYIDPFGLGAPPISKETIKHVLEREHAELFMHLNVDALIRVAGWLRHLDNSDKRLQQQAVSYYNTLRAVFGEDRIEEFHSQWLSWREGEREKKTLDYYLARLRDYYPYVQHIEIPVGSKRPVYYLAYTSRNMTGKKIMEGIMMKARRKGAESLEKWFRPRPE